MAKRERARSVIPEQFGTIEETADFWDTHDLADFWDLTEPADFAVDLKHRRYLVALDPELAERIVAEAHKRGLSSETLVNLWLAEKLRQATA